jgi:hypothetical protein
MPTKNDIYEVKVENWHQTLPYGFKFVFNKTKGGQGQSSICYLPIGPSDLTISTQFATNLINTLYGIIEEHSPVRYYDIQINGNTGFAPKYYDHSNSFDQNPSEGRLTSINTDFFSNGAGGFGARLASIVDNTAQEISRTASDIIDSASLEDMTNSTGINNLFTGYAAFHNFYRWMLWCKDKMAEGHGTEQDPPALYFFSKKDNTQYKVTLQNFTLKRTANDPMLYYYSITMRGYELKTLEVNPSMSILPTFDQRLTQLGLNGVDQSMFAKIYNVANTVKRVSTIILNAVKLSNLER